MITLYVLQGADKGKRFDLPGNDPIPLGRASDVAPLTDLTVSRRHAHLELRKVGWVLLDEGSSNGVFVNGVKVNKQCNVKIGDQIRLGSTLMVFGSPSQSVNMAADQPDLDGRKAELSDSSIISTVPSNDDSVILAAPEPTAAAMAHFRVLLKISAAIGSIFELDDLLNNVMDVVFDQMHADRGFIGLMDEKTDKVTPVVVRYRDAEPSERIAVSQTIIRHVISKNEGVLSSNAMTDKRFSKGKSVHDLSIRSAICVPIKGRDRVLGVIHVDTMVANYTYTADQLRLLTAIGLQTGMAIENLRLYREAVKKERLAAAGETVASLSHSIKNILQGIRGGADVIDMALKKGNVEEIRTGWKMLNRNVDKVSNLTMNMLAYSKQRTPHLELTHMPHVLTECLELVRAMAADKGVDLLTEISQTQPPVPVDADGIHQAILNLLGNAVEAVEPRSGVVTLSSQYDPVKEESVIEVQDNGVGIERYDLDKIFMPFFSTKGQRGTGLGLAVTKKIVEEHDGKIEVQSKVGQGTTFRIRLPMNNRTLPNAAQTHGPRG